MSSSVFPVPLSGIQETILNAKGDLIVASAADVPAILTAAATLSKDLHSQTSPDTKIKT